MSTNRLLSLFLMLPGIAAAAFGQSTPRSASHVKPPVLPLYELSYTTIDGKTVPLESLNGKWILFVNVASQCGYTPQYAELEKLHRACGDRLVILGFPANDFGAQEPGTDAEIATFCSTKYDVTFSIARKAHVIGDDVQPVYRWLTDPAQNGWNADAPKWNFYKYLVNPEGMLVQVFPSKVKPLGPEIRALIGACE